MFYPCITFVFRELTQGRCKSMESLLIQEQSKGSSVFYTADDSSSESNTSERSRHRDEDAHSPRKHNTGSRTPEPRKEKINSESTGSPRLSRNMPQNMAHAQSVPTLEGYDRSYRTPSRVPDKSALSRVSYEGSSTGEYQVRYVGGYRSGPEDESDEPLRLTTYDRSPTCLRRGSESTEGVDVSRIEDYTQASSTTSENSTTTYSVRKLREERTDRDVPLNFSRSPTSSPYLRRKAQEIQSSPINAQSAGSSPVHGQKQKKTAIVSPLLDMSESNRPRSVPPGLMMFDPTDPESERIEQVSRGVF